MIKSNCIITLILAFIIHVTCLGQNASPPIKKTANESPTVLSDYDPYFVESKTITSEYGPNSIVRNMIQDQKGYIWIASWEGIIRYDGKNFTNFTNKDSLRRYHVFCALEDRKGNLWFGTIGGGIYVYDGASFINYTTREGLVFDGIGCIYEDKEGRIWIGTQNGISRYDGSAENIKAITFQNFTTEDGLTDNDINSIIEDKNGLIWIGTRGPACTYDGTNFSKLTQANGRAFVNVRCIIKDEMDKIWMGGNDGLWRYDGKSFYNLTESFVGYIYEDRKGNIWTNASGGSPKEWVLSRYDKRPLSYELPTATEIRREANMFFGIMQDNQENIWFGTLKGICRYDCDSFNYYKK